MKFSDSSLTSFLNSHGTSLEKMAFEDKTALERAFERLRAFKGESLVNFTHLPSQKDGLKLIVDEAKSLQKKYDHLLLLGIGGSSLGMKALSQALLGKEQKKITICDHLDEEEWARLSKTLSHEKTLLVVISKSGKTLESLAAFSYFKKFFKNQVVITDPKSGPLRAWCESQGVSSFEVPPGVGGRYSVLSPVGLLPAAFIGIDVDALLKGAESALAQTSENDLRKNMPLRNAFIHWILDRRFKKNLRVTLAYQPKLYGYTLWFSQLWAESVGKKDAQGEFVGSTPIAGLGPQDQHSQLQLHLEGPKDKIVTFLDLENDVGTILLDDSDPLFKEVKGLTVSQLRCAERQATEKALMEQGRPSLTLLLPKLDAYSVGELLMFSELETAYAGYLYDINPFDQPSVELIKKNIPLYL